MHLPRVFFLLLLLTLTLTSVSSEKQAEQHNPPAEQHNPPAVNNAHVDKSPVINVKNVEKTEKVKEKTVADQKHNDVVDHPATEMNVVKVPHNADDLMQSGALQRAFYVLLGGTLLLLLFLAFRMYRLHKGGGKPNIMVRKYGVLANRRDVEMLPLPLDEDDEDDTVFEVGGARIETHS